MVPEGTDWQVDLYNEEDFIEMMKGPWSSVYTIKHDVSAD